MGEKEEKVTKKDVGKGLMLLGLVLLLLTAVFYIMSKWQEEYYGLFSGTTHIKFDLVLGLCLLGIGFFLARPLKEPEPSE